MDKMKLENYAGIYENTDKWESGELGESRETARLSSISLESLREAADLQSISIRMPKALLDDLKDIANINNLGYQPLMKQILQRFVDAEKKMMLKEYMNQKLNENDSAKRYG